MAKGNYKPSIYCHLQGNTLWNDYKNQSFSLNDNQVISVRDILQKKEIINIELLSEKEFAIYKDIGLIVDKSTPEETLFYPYRVDIETITSCNFSCKYCPQSIERKKRCVMDISVFKTVINRLNDYNVDFITFQHYGEPLLDPFFFERLNYITEKGMKLFLFSNGLLLTEEIVNKLVSYELYGIAINIPSLDSKEWSSLTGQKEEKLSTILKNIKYFSAKYKHKLQQYEIVVNGIKPTLKDKARELKKYFSDETIKPKIIEWYSHSRAGNINNEFVEISCYKDAEFFNGCERIVGHLHISFNGDVFLCCQDYHQENIIGNLLDDSIEEIMSSKKAVLLREMIYGQRPMSKNLLCRNCIRLREITK